MDFIRPEFATIIQGETRSIALRIANGDGTPYNLTAVTEVRARFRKANGNYLEKTINGPDAGVAIVDAVSGRILVSLPSDDTSALRLGDRQDFSVVIEFGGIRASATYSAVTYTAQEAGPPGNLITLIFDGAKTVATVVAAWNASSPQNLVSFTPTLSGPNVPGAGTVILAGGAEPTTTRIVNFGRALNVDRESV